MKILKRREELRKTLLALLMVTVIAVAVFAQNGPRSGRPGFGNSPGADAGQRGPQARLEGLKAALNLTDAQVEAIRALNQTRMTRAQAIMTEMQQKRQALGTLLDAATPNPTDVGNAAIALHASQKKLAAERDWFIAELKKLLTGDQQQKLDTLLAANPRLLQGGGGPGRGRGPR